MVFGFQATACASKTAAGPTVENNVSSNQIEKVLREKTEALLSLPGVLGAAQGLCNDQPCIKVFVKKQSPELDQKIRKHFEGVPVEIEETGTIRPLPRKE